MGLEETFLTHTFFELNTSPRLGRETGDGNPRQQSLGPLGKSITSLVPPIQRWRLDLSYKTGLNVGTNQVCGLPCASSLSVQSRNMVRGLGMKVPMQIQVQESNPIATLTRFISHNRRSCTRFCSIIHLNLGSGTLEQFFTDVNQIFYVQG